MRYDESIVTFIVMTIDENVLKFIKFVLHNHRFDCRLNQWIKTNKQKQSRAHTQQHLPTHTHSITCNVHTQSVYIEWPKIEYRCVMPMYYYMTGTGRSNVLGNRLKILQWSICVCMLRLYSGCSTTTYANRNGTSFLNGWMQACHLSLSHFVCMHVHYSIPICSHIAIEFFYRSSQT